jgi:hypothetical protein
MEASPTHVGRAWRALDALNFFLADVRGGLGPYLAIYLLTVQNWNVWITRYPAEGWRY